MFLEGMALNTGAMRLCTLEKLFSRISNANNIQSGCHIQQHELIAFVQLRSLNSVCL